MHKVLFWDFDGTLVHSNSLWSGSVYDALKHFGYAVGFQDVRSHLRTGFTWHTPDRDYSALTGQAWWDHMFAHFNLLYSQNDIRVPYDDINQKVREMILSPESYTVYGDAASTLSACMLRGMIIIYYLIIIRNCGRLYAPCIWMGILTGM